MRILAAQMPDWYRQHQELFVSAGIASVVMFIATLIVVPIIVSRMDKDYFMPDRPRSFGNRHPVVRIIGLFLKNILGAIFVTMGIVMIFVPGQGLLTILLGLALLSFPGKEAAELRLVRYPPLRKSIDWIRGKADKPPLNIPDA